MHAKQFASIPIPRVEFDTKTSPKTIIKYTKTNFMHVWKQFVSKPVLGAKFGTKTSPKEYQFVP